MKLQVLDINGKETGKTVDLPEDIFGIEPNAHTIYLAVKAHLANKRQGTHKAKTRNEIAGSTRKLYRQKGTGNARKGDIKSPVLRGGGRVFGPVPRDYSQKLNKKVKQLARKSALSTRASEGNILVVEDFNFEAPKTKNYIQFLNNLKVLDSKSTLVVAENNKNVFLSARNLPKASVQLAKDLSTYEIVNTNKLIFAESAISTISESFTK